MHLSTDIISKRINKFLKILMIYIAISGLYSFSAFILEESMQTIMFGTWAAQDAGDWALVMTGCQTNRKINKLLKIVNYSVGWIQPFAFIAYKSYGEAMDFYIEALERKVLKREPGLFIGRELTLTVQPVNHRKTDNGYLVKTKTLLIISPSELHANDKVTGIIIKYKNTVALNLKEVL